MKVWEVDGRSITLRYDSKRLDGQPKDVTWKEKVTKRLNEEWPDVVNWENKSLVSSSDSEEWECGSFGPKGVTCKRLTNHRGKCSDIFLPEDREKLTEKVKTVKFEDLDKIVGLAPRTAKTRRFNLKKIKNLLR